MGQRRRDGGLPRPRHQLAAMVGDAARRARGRRPGLLRERLRIGRFRSGRRAPGRARRTAGTGSRRHCRRRPAVGRPPLGPGPAVRGAAVAPGQRAGAADEPPAQPRPARRQLVTFAQPASAAPAAGRIGSGRSASAGQHPVWPGAIARCTGTALRAHWRQPALRPGPARRASGQRAGRRTQPAAAARPALLRRHRDHPGGAAVGWGPEPARSRKRHWPPLFLAARGAGGWDRRRRGRARRGVCRPAADLGHACRQGGGGVHPSAGAGGDP